MTYIHRRTRKKYTITGFTIIEATLTPAVIYSPEEDPSVSWVRPCSEFFDGRFEQIINMPVQTKT